MFHENIDLLSKFMLKSLLVKVVFYLRLLAAVTPTNQTTGLKICGLWNPNGLWYVNILVTHALAQMIWPF